MKYNLIFLITSFLATSLLYALILAVDPYNKLENNFFDFKTKAVDFSRVNKFNQVEHAKKNYTAFLLGSSSAHRYETSVINRLTGLVSYNYSTQSATPEDFIAMTRHILTRHRPKLLLISFDYEGLNSKTKTDDMFYASPLKNFLFEVPDEKLKTVFLNNTYFTLEALIDTFKVIWVNLFGNPLHTYREDGNHPHEPKPLTLTISQFQRSEYTLDKKRLDYIREIKKLGEKNGFKIVPFTSPLSIEHLLMVWSIPGLKEKHEEFKEALINIFEHLYDFQNEGIRPYSTVDYFQNSNHPGTTLSTAVLERIFKDENIKHPEFGKLIIKKKADP